MHCSDVVCCLRQLHEHCHVVNLCPYVAWCITQMLQMQLIGSRAHNNWVAWLVSFSVRYLWYDVSQRWLHFIGQNMALDQHETNGYVSLVISYHSAGVYSESEGRRDHQNAAHHLYYMLAGLHEKIALTLLTTGDSAWLTEYMAMLPAQLDEAVYTKWIKVCGQHRNAAALSHVVEVRLYAIEGCYACDCLRLVCRRNCSVCIR